MKFERRLHNGKWAAYVRVLGIWWFIRDFDNAKKAGYFVSIAMGQNILRPRKEKKVPPPPAAPSVMGSHEFEGDSGDGRAASAPRFSSRPSRTPSTIRRSGLWRNSRTGR